MNKNKIFMIVSICILCISIIGSAYAMYKEILFEDLNVNTITHGLDYYINYAKGTDITSGTLSPSNSYTTGNNATIEFYKRDDTYDIYGHIYLDINAIGPISKNSTGLKYTLTDNSNAVIASDRITGEAGSSLLIASNIPLETTKQLYTIYVWLDENEELDPDMASENLEISIRCEATMQQI